MIKLKTGFGALVALYAVACSAQAEEALIGYISPIAAQPGQQLINGAIEAASKEKGWQYRVLDANLSADKQVSHVDTLLNLGAKAIGSWSLDANAVAGAYQRANEQGVPVIGVNSVGQGVTNTVWWEVNTCNPGGPYERQAKWIAEKVPNAKVIVFGGPPVASIMMNAKCFTEAAKAAGLEVIDRVDNTKDSTANAATLASDELIRFPDVQAFWAYNDSSALGISASVIAAGKSVYSGSNTDGVMVFGINGDADAIAAVREGRLTGTWDPDASATGFAVARAMDEAMSNPTGEHKPIVVAGTFFTSENIATWVKDTKRGYSIGQFPEVK
ncbi:sugar ABC transporter substrate-binding protein [Mesorhizobium sp. LHD-90]|uniref:sugar ABC transporter substrate-binding protein n=1 Tax=Mesorhizobium sp. LHD-90 TaxID=3071414 RepID=UPI0027DF23DA|nr:sugar ABC transporter substrate-binding protein [Mesorhizobium sp. LHD-90]MDQ6438072.1 sugar ABC transporter substrate-binding protein [Mesorhizobium sp. LHD-90]